MSTDPNKDPEPGDSNPMINALCRLVEEEDAYPLEAYVFVYQALDHAQRLVGERRHVSGRELLDGIRALAIELFGPLTLMVFDHWGVVCTKDFGQIVFHLVERELMGKTEEDCLEDFDGVYEFSVAFDPDQVLAKLDPTVLEPTNWLTTSRELGSSRARVSQG